jgi:hypothetical protein
MLVGKVKMTVPPGTPLVIGIPAQAQEYSLDFPVNFPPNFGSGMPIPVTINGQTVSVSFVKMRD